MTGSQRFWLKLLKVLRQGFQGCWHESYAKELWTEELHHVFALKAHVLGTFHHVFTLDSLSGSYL